MNCSVLQDNHEFDFTISNMLSESELSCVSQRPNLQFEENDFNMTIQSNLNGSNIFGTMGIRSRHG